MIGTKEKKSQSVREDEVGEKKRKLDRKRERN